MHHDLKIKAPFFQAVVEGRKTFEIRDTSDRGFQAGDTVCLEEIDRIGVITLRRASADIGYVCSYGQRENMVVFSLLNVTPRVTPQAQGEASDDEG